MANYYVLCPNYDVTPMLGMAEDSSCRDAIWQTGRRLDDSDYDLSDLCFEAEGAHLTPFPDFGMDANGCPVFSARLRELLAFDGIDNIDFYPASIIEFGSSDRRPGYLAANIIGLISCMDRPNSTFEEIGRGSSISRVSLSKEKRPKMRGSSGLKRFRA